jgi:hypothetical protein
MLNQHQPNSRPGIGSREDCDARMILGTRTKPTLRTVLRHLEEHGTRTYRREVMQAAKREAARNRKARREASEGTVKTPLLSLREDVRQGRLPNGSAVVIDERKVELWDRHYMTVREECRGAIVQLERLYADYLSVRRVTEATMRKEGTKQPSATASVRGKASRGTTTMYLTAKDLQRIADSAIGGYVTVKDENAKGIKCVSYFRNRHSRVEGIVRRHLREAGI